MNKASGKLAAGVRKMKIQQKPAVEAPAAAPGERPAAALESPHPVAAPRETAARQAMHPERVWPD